MASLHLIFSWIYCPDEMKASPGHIYLCSIGFWYHTTDIHQMVRVPQNIFFWNASAVFGKLRNPIPLTSTTTYEETFISIEIYIASSLLLLKTAPAILNCHAWISSKSVQMLSLNFLNLLGDKPPVLLCTTDLPEEQTIKAKITKSSVPPVLPQLACDFFLFFWLFCSRLF